MDSQYYNNPQLPHSNYTYYPPLHLPQQNLNPPLNYHQIPIPQPPGVHHYTTTPPNSYHYTTNSVDLGYPHHLSSQVGTLNTPSYYQDPTFTQPSVAIHQYGVASTNVGYSAAIDPPHNIVYPADVNNPSSHPSANGDIPRIPAIPRVLQPLRCEVCSVDCNSKDSLDTHMQGKKHKNALLLQQKRSKTVVFPPYASMPQGTIGSSLVSTSGDLATKTKKLVEGGAAVDSVLTCSTCNVVCNNQVVFETHLVGKKHASQVGMLKKSTIVQSAWCEICSIECTSQDALKTHRKGKKHQKNLKKLHIANIHVSTSSQIPSMSIIGPQENPSNNNGNVVKRAKKKAASVEDVEAKRQKVVSGGAAADAVRVCSICNVVCNSQFVFNTHLVGQKHISMVKKHAEANGSVH
ncbi:hypothetical protein ACHQM5_006526 [Ranunculus cassubicifolius]